MEVAEVARKTVEKPRGGPISLRVSFSTRIEQVYVVLKQESLMCGTGKSFDRKNEM